MIKDPSRTEIYDISSVHQGCTVVQLGFGKD
jgi:hypothetical protein